MAFEPKPGQFSLFKNDKDGNESRPDYTGDGMALDGTLIRVAAWKKEGRNGTFLSCKIQPKEPRQEQAAPPPKQDSGKLSDIESDIPF